MVQLTWFFAGTVAILYLLYRYILPRPIPGIPYNHEAVRTPLGDVPTMSKHVNETQEIWSFMTKQNIKHKSPIVQVFVRPDSTHFRLGPWVSLCDARESYDILVRRTREFDRSPVLANFLRLVARTQHVMMPTGEQWKARRYLISDVITPNFLHSVTAVQLHSSLSNLCGLWKEKMRLAQGRPFSVVNDIFNSGLEAIWASTFGLGGSVIATLPQIQLLSLLKAIPLPTGFDEPANVPVTPYPPEFAAIMTIVGTANETAKSLFPAMASWFISRTQPFKRALSIKEQIIADLISKTSTHFTTEKKPDLKVTCAMDAILRRELIVAEKQSREPNFYSRDVIDEIFGVVVGGYDTTSTALCWAVKLLADNQGAQNKIRNTLRAAYLNAVAEGRAPTATEIVETPIPYIDASVEEIIRHSLTQPSVLRITTQDVDVLGHTIPKGTTILMMGNGPSFMTPGLEVDEDLRSPTSRTANNRIGAWDPKDIHLFKPERWLIEEDDKIVFNPSAGPHLTFGLGVRGCFGRKLATLQMKIAVTLIVWNFIIQKVPDELGGYAAHDALTHLPQQCYLRLAPVA